MSKLKSIKNPSPRKQLSHSHSHYDDRSLGWADLKAMAEDYDLEAESYLRTLLKKEEERLAAVARHWKDSISTLHDRVRDLSLARFVDEFGSDPQRALAKVVEEEMRPAMLAQVEQSARKRKRVAPLSPRNGRDDDDTDVFSTSKKPRAGGPLFSSAIKSKKVPSSVSHSTAAGGTARTRSGATSGLSPTSVSVSPLVLLLLCEEQRLTDFSRRRGQTRKTRLRVRPSSHAAAPPSASSSNFIYRANPLLPPTPSHASTTSNAARRPRRGESIVMRSLNDSPLGEFVASEEEELGSDDDDDDDDDDENGEEDDWDLMERNEASNVNSQSAGGTRGGKLAKKLKPTSKGSIKDKDKATPASAAASAAATATAPLPRSDSARSIVPTAPAFDPSVALPVDAPSFDALKARWMAEMQAKLAAQHDLSDGERGRLEEVLRRSMNDL
ncbi:hypothetical protein JCM5296_001907 [Sporobolomyces johnsonii]